MGEISELLQRLKHQREELALKIHLGTMEAKQEWEIIEQKWQKFAARAELEESGEGISDALKLLGSELKQSYERIRKAM